MYRNLRLAHFHQRRVREEPTNTPSDRATQIAHAASLISALLMLGFIAASLCTIDRLMLPHVVNWVCTVDQLRLALGMGSIVRVLITHAETRTLVMSAGFFTYMFLYSFYNGWVIAERTVAQVFTTQSDPEVEPSEHPSRWP